MTTLGTNESAIFDRKSGWGHTATTQLVPTGATVSVVAYDGQNVVPSVTAPTEAHGTSGTDANTVASIAGRGQSNGLYQTGQNPAVFPSNGSSPLEAQLAPGRGLNDRTGAVQVGTADGSWAANGVTVYDHKTVYDALKVGELYHDGGAPTNSASTNFTTPPVGERVVADRTSGWGHGATTIRPVDAANTYHD